MLCFVNFVTMWMKLLLDQFIMLFFIPIFHMIVLHGVRIWTQKAMQIISFTHYDAHTLPIFTKLNIIKFSDPISLHNCLFIYKHFISKPASVFSHVFILASNTHEQNTRFGSHGLLAKPTCNTSNYGTNGCAISAIASRNFFQNKFPSNSLREIFFSFFFNWDSLHARLNSH